MNPSYCRMHLPKSEVVQRFAVWRGVEHVGSLTPVDSDRAISLALDSAGRWRGHALFVSHTRGWTVLTDLSGDLSARDPRTWAALGDDSDLMFAGYNDAIQYGELIIVERGTIVRDAFFDAAQPRKNRNHGRIADDCEPIGGWADVARFVDSDDLGFGEKKGELWIYRDD
jgi:hypothetical protein